MTTSQLELEQIRQQLLVELNSLEHRLGIVADHMAAGADYDVQLNLDRSDLADEYAERERDVALLAIEQDQLEHIKAALARIDDGTYGICLDCGEPISPERLEVLPYATTCIRCQSKHKT